MEPIDKFDYLIGLLHGPAATAVEGFEVTRANFFQELLKEVELREINSSRNNHSSSEVKRKPDVTTASALFMKKNTLECAFCRGNFLHEDCRKVVDLEDRKRS